MGFSCASPSMNHHIRRIWNGVSFSLCFYYVSSEFHSYVNHISLEGIQLSCFFLENIDFWKINFSVDVLNMINVLFHAVNIISIKMNIIWMELFSFFLAFCIFLFSSSIQFFPDFREIQAFICFLYIVPCLFYIMKMFHHFAFYLFYSFIIVHV